MDDFDLHLLEVDQGVIEGQILVSGTVIAAFICNGRVAGRVASISRLHLDGAGPNTLGARRLHRAMVWLMDALDVDEIVIEGGQCVTGAAKGPAGTGPRTQARLSFKREST